MVKDVEMRDGSAGSCGKSKEIVEAQRTYYMEGKTRALSARIDALNRLEQSILTYEQELYQALRSDLGSGADFIRASVCETSCEELEQEQTGTHPAGTVPCSKLYGAGAIWGGAHYVSVELPDAPDAGAIDRSTGSGQLLCVEAVCLFTGDFSCDGEADPGSISFRLCDGDRRRQERK